PPGLLAGSTAKAVRSFTCELAHRTALAAQFLRSLPANLRSLFAALFFELRLHPVAEEIRRFPRRIRRRQSPEPGRCRYHDLPTQSVTPAVALDLLRTFLNAFFCARGLTISHLSTSLVSMPLPTAPPV